MSDKQVLLTYSALDNLYSNGSVRFVGGLQDAVSTTPTVGTVDAPADTGAPLAATDPDPKLFSFGYNGGARMLLAKVVTPVSGTATYTTWTLLEVPSPVPAPTPDPSAWTVLAEDIILQYPAKNPATVATNPYGVAQVGDWLYIVDYDSQKIYTLGTNELNGLAKGSFHTLAEAPFDLGPYGENELPTNAMGQAIIALSNAGADYLFALYTVSDTPYTSQNPGILVRLEVDRETGELTYDTQVEVGANPQEIIPLTKTNGNVSLVVPAVGGIQQTGSSNGVLSNIISVPAFASSWPATAPVLVKGAASGTHDIFAVAGPDRAGDGGIVYILTHDYGANNGGTDWRLYSITVNDLLTLSNATLSTPTFTDVDSGTGASGYFWDILYENGAVAANDRLWFFQGTPLRVSPALAYATNVLFPVGTGTGQIGGQNVDWADLTIETLRQALAGKSLKRSVRAAKPPATEEEEK
jgi:hypothetical protein